MGAGEARGPVVALHIVPLEIVVDQLPLLFDHLLLAVHQLLQSAVLTNREIHAEYLAAAEAGKLQRSLPKRLGWNRSCVDARAAEDIVALDERNAPAEVRCLRSSLLACRAGPDYDEIVFLHRPLSIHSKAQRTTDFEQPVREAALPGLAGWRHDTVIARIPQSQGDSCHLRPLTKSSGVPLVPDRYWFAWRQPCR